MFDLEVGQVGVLEDRGVLDVKLFNIEIIFALEQQVLVEFVVERRSTEAIFKVVDQHDLD